LFDIFYKVFNNIAISEALLFDCNDTKHSGLNRVLAFKKIKAVWNESRKLSKIKVKSRNIFESLKDLTSYYDHNITILRYTQKGDRRRICQKDLTGKSQIQSRKYQKDS